jgi:hypothetical protein
VLDPVTTVGAAAGPAGPTPFSTLVRSDGLYYVAPTYNPGEISVFDSNGDFVRSIGSYGIGPGENRDALRVEVLGDTVFVYDATTRRIARYLTGGAFIGSTVLLQGRTPFEPRHGGGLVTIRNLRDSGPVLLDVRSDTTLLYTVAVSNESTAEATERDNLRLRDVDGVAFWVGSMRRYLFELYSYDGERVARIARNFDWFPDPRALEADRASYRTFGVVADIEVDRRRRLFVLMLCYPLRRDDSAGMVETLAPAAVVGDVVIHLVDPIDGRLVAQYEQPREVLRLRGFADEAHVYGRSELPDGTPVLEVFRIRMRQANSREVCS